MQKRLSMKYYHILLSCILISCGHSEPETSAEPTENPLAETETASATNFTDETGQKQGYWITYGADFPERGFPSEGKIEEGNYLDGVKVGHWIYYESDGKTIAYKTDYGHVSDRNKQDSNGNKKGYWIILGQDAADETYRSEAIVESGNYQNNTKAGVWISYDPEGNIVSVKDHGGRKPVNQVDSHGLKQGYWIFYGIDFPESGFAEKAVIEQGNFIDDQKDGQWFYHAKNGEIDSILVYREGEVNRIFP